MVNDKPRDRLARFPRAVQGTASVEFALMLPVVVLLLFGTVEVGRLVSDYHAVLKGVRDATRYLTRLDAVTCNALGPGTIDAGAVGEARNLALSGRITAPAATDLRLFYWSDPTSIAVDVECLDKTTLAGAYVDDDFVPQIEVTATVPFVVLFGDLILDGGDFDMTVSHRQAHVGE